MTREELKALAEKATPGPWKEIETESSVDYTVDHPDGRTTINAWGEIGTDDGEPPIAIVPQIYDSRDGTVTPMDDNIAFMLAANPATVLSLLASLEEAEAVLKIVRETIPMDYLERHPGDIPSAMRDYAKDRWTLIDRITETRARAEASERREAGLKKRMAEIDDAIWSAMQSQAEDVRVNGDAHRPMLEILQRLHEQSRAALKSETPSDV